jgi:hypothetical protein
MYLADSVGYLGYAALMIGKSFLPIQGDFLRFYTMISWLIAGLALAGLILASLYFAGRGQAKVAVGAEV